MSEKPRNALAELAERLSPRGETKTLLLVNAQDILKAQRIVAELAKVEYVYNPSTGEPIALPGEASNAVVKSRAIAEEGAGDGGSL